MLICGKRYKSILYYKEIQNFCFFLKKLSLLAIARQVGEKPINPLLKNLFIKEIKFLKLNFLNMLYRNDKNFNNNMAFAIRSFASLYK